MAASSRTRVEPSLLAGLVDDAAVFPPGNASLTAAVAGHRALRSGPYAALVGPLLVPASGVQDLVTLLGPDADLLRVAVVARPGVAATEVLAALDATALSPVEVVGVELGAGAGWESLLGRGPAVTVEVPRDQTQQAVIESVAARAARAPGLQAKFRTGATPTWPWPDEIELAAFVRACVDHDLGFKLTGGLHHAVRGSYAADPGGPESEDQHGLLNVLTAVRWALNGEEVPALADLLAERDPDILVDAVTRMSTADAAITRAFFTAYGCCGVLDPIGELAQLGLVDEVAR